MGDLKPWRAFYVLYYKRSDKKLVFEHRFGKLTEAGYTIKVHVPEVNASYSGQLGIINFFWILSMMIGQQ